MSYPNFRFIGLIPAHISCATEEQHVTRDWNNTKWRKQRIGEARKGTRTRRED